MDNNPRHFKYVLVVSSLTFNDHYSKKLTSNRYSTNNRVAIKTLRRYADYYYTINN